MNVMDSPTNGLLVAAIQPKKRSSAVLSASAEMDYTAPPARRAAEAEGGFSV